MMMPLQFNMISERITGVKGKYFDGNKRKNFYVRLSIESEDPASMRDVHFVIYELHPTFRKPKRISRDAENGFELKIWTWGFFNVDCQIYMKTGEVYSINGYVKYDTKD